MEATSEPRGKGEGSTKPTALLEVHPPDGSGARVLELASSQVSVGRPAPGTRPDVSLEPDPQRWVSRLHCVLERERGAWWVSDNATPNGTFLRRRSELERIVGRRRLQNGDEICILGDLDATGPRYWRLVLIDPFATRSRTDPSEPGDCLEYDWVQARLFRRQGSQRVDVGELSPKAHQLIRYMAQRSQQNGGAPVACGHDELIQAVWGDPSEWPPYRSYTRENLRDLVSDLRRRIEPDPSKARLLQAVPGQGYRLMICPPTDERETMV